MVALGFYAASVLVEVIAPLILFALFVDASVGEHRVDGLRRLAVVAKALVFVVEQDFAVLVIAHVIVVRMLADEIAAVHRGLSVVPFIQAVVDFSNHRRTVAFLLIVNDDAEPIVRLVLLVVLYQFLGLGIVSTNGLQAFILCLGNSSTTIGSIIIAFGLHEFTEDAEVMV